MRALIIGPEEQASIRRVIAYAEQPDNYYDMDHPGPPPGDYPPYVAHIPDGFRCVFTITRHHGKLFRHLSVSVPGERYPSPEACVMLGKEFGFRTSDDDLDIRARLQRDGWIASPSQSEHCIVMVQVLEA